MEKLKNYRVLFCHRIVASDMTFTWHRTSCLHHSLVTKKFIFQMFLPTYERTARISLARSLGQHWEGDRSLPTESAGVWPNSATALDNITRKAVYFCHGKSVDKRFIKLLSLI